MLFYSNEEYSAQVQDLVEAGVSPGDAQGIVDARELQDQREYNEWVIEQFKQAELETL
jgi:uncharacterized protein YoaH (UPF0181 family)